MPSFSLTCTCGIEICLVSTLFVINSEVFIATPVAARAKDAFTAAGSTNTANVPPDTTLTVVPAAKTRAAPT